MHRTSAIPTPKPAAKTFPAFTTQLHSQHKNEKSMKRTSDIEISLYGEMQGTFWWPYGVPFTQEHSLRYSLDDKPFTRKWEGIQSALNDLHNASSGDSSSDPEILYARLTIRRNLWKPTDYNPECVALVGATERYYDIII